MKYEELLKLSKNLRHSMGHQTHCSKIGRSCNCGAAEEQIQAIYEFDKFIEENEND